MGREKLSFKRNSVRRTLMEENVAETRQVLDVLFDISNLLNTGLTKEALAVCFELCESGVNPEALATVIKELKREKRAEEIEPSL